MGFKFLSLDEMTNHSIYTATRIGKGKGIYYVSNTELDRVDNGDQRYPTSALKLVKWAGCRRQYQMIEVKNQLILRSLVSQIKRKKSK